MTTCTSCGSEAATYCRHCLITSLLNTGFAKTLEEARDLLRRQFPDLFPDDLPPRPHPDLFER